MATYTKETALYDTGAIANDIQEAGEQVNKYITRVGDDGIKVHPYNTTTGEPDTANYSKIDADGMTIYKDERQVATFGENTVIGKPYDSEASDNESHIEMDYHSLRLVNKEGRAYVHFSDLRNKSGIATVTNTFTGDGSKTYFTTDADITIDDWRSDLVDVKINDEVVDPSEYTVYTTTGIAINFNTAPADLAVIKITYTTNWWWNEAFTLGTRGSGNIGKMSFTAGLDNVASAGHATAIGSNARATAWDAVAGRVL